ncbi:MAG: PH domain-containing protein [Chloroflexi bacterium]|nr:PH domain-containing protein [Chloroflexota bacterium]
MRFHPPRLTGLLLGLMFLAVTAGAATLGLIQLGNIGFSAWIAVWIALPILGVPAALVVAYRLFGLLTASYQLDRDGFRLRWGLAVEQVPLADVHEVKVPDQEAAHLRPGQGIWWPGCVVGHRSVDGLGLVEFFASTSAAGMLLLQLEDRWLAISPSDLDGFRQAYVDMMRMGSLERIAAVRLRPDFLFNRPWSDRWARGLILAGLGLSLLLLGFLAFQASTLLTQVPFGFDPYGAPEGFVSSTRLLLLPMIAGLCWLADFVIGLWLYRKDEQRPLAYGLWGTAVLVGGLLWGASLQLLAAAR